MMLQFSSKFNTTKKIQLLGFGLSLSLVVPLYAASETLSIEIARTPLSMGVIPTQRGTANAPFVFDLRPFVTHIENHITYEVTNNTHVTLNDIEIKSRLPSGITPTGGQAHYWSCEKKFDLKPKARCFLHFNVDDSLYESNAGNELLLCSQGQCFSPSEGHQLDNAVALSPGATQFEVTTEGANGIDYNPEHMSLEGIPQHRDIMLFHIGAYNKNQSAEATRLFVEIAADPAETPRFKEHPVVPIASPGSSYQLNLMELLESNNEFKKSNQVRFRLWENASQIPGLSISDENPTLLQGTVPDTAAGSTLKVWVVATSNSGGDALGSFEIPVAPDILKRPVIKKGLTVHRVVHDVLDLDLAYYIQVAEHSTQLKVVIDEVKPIAPWLDVLGTRIRGAIDYDLVGQVFDITVRAITKEGGSSEPEHITLYIEKDPQLKPYFNNKLHLPELVVGASYLYDFVANNTVTPYDIPYTISLDDKEQNPSWISIKENKLIIDKVPEGIRFHISVSVTLENKVGGTTRSRLWIGVAEDDITKK